MSIILRLLLIVISIMALYYVLRKIRKSQLQIEDSIFWIAFSVGIFILSIFPIIAIKFSQLIGIESPANFIFLIMIFILLLKVFVMSIKISQLEHKIKIIVQDIAIKENIRNMEKSDMVKLEDNKVS